MIEHTEEAPEVDYKAYAMALRQLEMSSLVWSGVIPSSGWYELTLWDETLLDDDEDRDDPNTWVRLEPVLAWAWVEVKLETGNWWHALVGVIRRPSPNFDGGGGAGLAELDAEYLHESELTPDKKQKLMERAKARSVEIVEWHTARREAHQEQEGLDNPE